MTPNEKWELNIYITNQKRIERNLSENLGKITSDLNQDYQYLSQKVNEKTNN